MDGRFQPRHIYICLETNVIFDVGSIVYPDEKQPLEIITSDFKSTFVPSLSAETNENLDSPIKALISSDEFFFDGGILLNNEFVLFPAIGEFETCAKFYPLSKMMGASYMELKIKDD
jgi:hypothetical protein